MKSINSSTTVHQKEKSMQQNMKTKTNGGIQDYNNRGNNMHNN